MTQQLFQLRLSIGQARDVALLGIISVTTVCFEDKMKRYLEPVISGSKR